MGLEMHRDELPALQFIAKVESDLVNLALSASLLVDVLLDIRKLILFLVETVNREVGAFESCDNMSVNASTTKR